MCGAADHRRAAVGPFPADLTRRREPRAAPTGGAPPAAPGWRRRDEGGEDRAGQQRHREDEQDRRRHAGSAAGAAAGDPGSGAASAAGVPGAETSTTTTVTLSAPPARFARRTSSSAAAPGSRDLAQDPFDGGLGDLAAQPIGAEEVSITASAESSVVVTAARGSDPRAWVSEVAPVVGRGPGLADARRPGPARRRRCGPPSAAPGVRRGGGRPASRRRATTCALSASVQRHAGRAHPATAGPAARGLPDLAVRGLDRRDEIGTGRGGIEPGGRSTSICAATSPAECPPSPSATTYSGGRTQEPVLVVVPGATHVGARGVTRGQGGLVIGGSSSHPAAGRRRPAHGSRSGRPRPGPGRSGWGGLRGLNP